MLTATSPGISSLFNQPFGQLLSRAPDENRGMPLADLMAPEDMPFEMQSEGAEGVWGGFDYVEINHGSIELMQGRALFQVEFTSVKTVQVRIASTQAPGEAENPPRWGLMSPLTRKYMPAFEEARELLDSAIEKLKEYFSPENVARRIFDFAITHYGKGSFTGEDTPELRERYRDFIMPAIDRGFADALAILGDLPEDVMESVDTTHDLIVEKFDQFAQVAHRQKAQ